jgi:hypothetical protein
MISVSVKGEKVVDHYGVMTSDFDTGEALPRIVLINTCVTFSLRTLAPTSSYQSSPPKFCCRRCRSTHLLPLLFIPKLKQTLLILVYSAHHHHYYYHFDRIGKVSQIHHHHLSHSLSSSQYVAVFPPSESPSGLICHSIRVQLVALLFIYSPRHFLPHIYSGFLLCH